MGQACANEEQMPAAAPRESDSGEVSDVLGDARYLVDYVEFLKEKGRTQDLKELRRYELEETDGSALSTSWEEYRHSRHIQSFDDAAEWGPHKLPAKDIVRQVTSDRHYVETENEMYGFAIAVMVGIDVATVGSRTIHDATVNGDLIEGGVRRYKVPASGSAHSPKLIIPEGFEIEEFCPEMFIQLRAQAGVSDEEYRDTLCRPDFQFIQFGSNSKSGEFFFFSHDMKYLIKTMDETEGETLIDMLPAMNKRFAEEPDSMLGRYLGLYRITLNAESPSTVEKPRLFFVMCNTNRSGLSVESTYDMKGSTRHRLAKPDEKVGKDLNFDQDLGQLPLSPQVAQDLMRIHKGDVDVLLDYRIMDYSLLLQIHDSQSKKPADKSEGQSVVLLGGPPTASKAVNRSKENPAYGIKSSDGRYTYFFGLIDILVPYDTFGEPKYMGFAYPQMQYFGNNIITCGKGDAASRVPPDHYRDRQVEMFEGMCGCAAE